MSEVTNSMADRRLTAAELAAAIREGIECRDWRFAAPTPAFPPDEFNALRHMPPVIDLTTMPIITKPGVRGRLVAVGRAVLRGLIYPWADQQTSFNRLTAHLIHHQGVQLADRADAAAAKLQQRVDELTRLYFEANRRLDELDARANGDKS